MEGPGLCEDVCDGGPGIVCMLSVFALLFLTQGIRIAPAKSPWENRTNFCLGRASALI